MNKDLCLIISKTKTFPGILYKSKYINRMDFIDWDNSEKEIEEYYKNPPKIILFSNGADIDARMYGEENTPHDYYTKSRDKFEQEVYSNFKGIVPIIGISRGFQMLWVLSGGKLIRNISPRHNLRHLCYLSLDWQIEEKAPNPNTRTESIYVNSTHTKGVSLEKSPKCLDTWEIIGTAPDGVIEAAINYNSRTAGIQFHPEYYSGEDNGRKLLLNIIDKLIELP